MPEIASYTPITRHDAVVLLNETSTPVIFWDTCALLDILRLPVSERNFSTDVLRRIMEIKKAIVDGKILSLASELTIKEFNDNVYEVEDELFKSIKKVGNKYNDLIEFINMLLPSAGFTPVDFTRLKFEDVLMDIIQSIVDKTHFVNQHDDFMRAATQRTIDKIAPAHEKGEFKDCYVWTTCLKVREESTQRSNIYGFASSNTRDYTEGSKIEFADAIKAEAIAANITYFCNFQLAYGKLNTLTGLF